MLLFYHCSTVSIRAIQKKKIIPDRIKDFPRFVDSHEHVWHSHIVNVTFLNIFEVGVGFPDPLVQLEKYVNILKPDNAVNGDECIDIR